MTIEDHYRDSWNRIKSDIDSKSDSSIINTDLEELTNFYYQKYYLPNIEIDTTRQNKMEKTETGSASKGMVKVGIPVILKEDLDLVISYTANPRIISLHFILEDDGYLVSLVDTYGSKISAGQIQQKLEILNTIISQKNYTVNSQNPQFKQRIENYLNQVKAKLQQDNDVLEQVASQLPIELVKNDSAPTPINIQVKKKIQIVKPESKQKTDPTLQKESVEAVLELIKNQGRQFEITPKIFSKHEEEDLRDIILTMLNAVFEGGATGESFVKKGKTDIHLKLNVEGGILSGECKFWGGEKLYSKTTDQHFTYLTWRQNYAIQITFSKIKGFSEVINKAIESAKSHSTYVPNSFSQISETHFITTNTFPEDAKKRVEIHHLLFNLYS